MNRRLCPRRRELDDGFDEVSYEKIATRIERQLRRHGNGAGKHRAGEDRAHPVGSKLLDRVVSAVGDEEVAGCIKGEPEGTINPVLAKIVPTPLGANFSIVSSPLLATKRLKDASKASPTGTFNPVLANTAPIPLGVSFTIVLLPELATKRLPAASNARAKAVFKPEVAKVVTDPSGLTRSISSTSQQRDHKCRLVWPRLEQAQQPKRQQRQAKKPETAWQRSAIAGLLYGWKGTAQPSSVSTPRDSSDRYLILSALSSRSEASPPVPISDSAASLFLHVLDKLGKRQTQCCEILDLCPTIRPVHSAPKWRRAAAKATCVGRYLLAAAVRFRQALLASDAPPTDSRDLHIQVLDR